MKLSDTIQKLVERLNKGQAILVSSTSALGNDQDIPTIHNFAAPEYWKTANHCGFGLFEGRTPNGTFQFTGGGAMEHEEYADGTYLSWTDLVASAEVLADLGYSIPRVRAALLSHL